MAAFFDKIAPINNAQKIAHPLFVVQGGNDPRVPLSEAEQMVERVKQNQKPVWYLMAKDEGHGFAKKGNADFQFYATVMFVRQLSAGSGRGGIESARDVRETDAVPFQPQSGRYASRYDRIMIG